MNHNPNHHGTPYGPPNQPDDGPDMISSSDPGTPADARSWRLPRFWSLRLIATDIWADLRTTRPGNHIHAIAGVLFLVFAWLPWTHRPTRPLPAITDTGPTGGGGGGFGPYAQLHSGPGVRLEVAGLDQDGPLTPTGAGLSLWPVVLACGLMLVSMLWSTRDPYSAERAPFAWPAGNIVFSLAAFVLTGFGVWQAWAASPPLWPAFACLALPLLTLVVAVGQNREEVTWRAARRANRDLVDRVATLIGATPTDRSGQW